VDATWLTLALAAGTFLVVEVLLLASVLRLWRRARAEPRPQGRLRLRWGRELVWTALPALGLLALAILSVRYLF
jgi:heme/copper-type cytochrome/quinol oxidase subunit 2